MKVSTTPAPRTLPARLRVLGSVLLFVVAFVLLSTLRPVHLHVSNVSQVHLAHAGSLAWRPECAQWA